MLVDLAISSIIGISAGYLVNRLAHGNSFGFVLYALIGAIGALVGALITSLALPQHVALTPYGAISMLVSLIASLLFLGIARIATMRYDARPTSLR